MDEPTTIPSRIVAPIGIMGAMVEEVDALLRQIDDPVIERAGMRDFIRGNLEGRPVVAVFSRIGKVAAAATASLLIERFKVREIIFGGVAGAIEPGLKIGDLVLGREFIQWDLDARPLFEYGEVPLLGMTRFPADEILTQKLEAAAQVLLEQWSQHHRLSELPILSQGTMATGDRFLANSSEVLNLRALVPDAKCVEMETAAVAQVCYEHGVPFAAFRILSDSADESAAVDFHRFLNDHAGPMAAQLVREFLKIKS